MYKFNLYSALRALADVHKDNSDSSLCQAMDNIAKELNLGNHSVLKKELSGLSYEDLYSKGMKYLGVISDEIFYHQMSINKSLIHQKYACEYAFLQLGYPPVDHVILNTQNLEDTRRCMNHSLFVFPDFNSIHIRREHLGNVYLGNDNNPYHVIKAITISSINIGNYEGFDTYYEKIICMFKYITSLDKDRIILFRDCYSEDLKEFLISKGDFISLRSSNGSDGVAYNYDSAIKAEELTV